MKKNVYFLLFSATSFLFTNLHAQSWVIGGNNVAANSSFGTNTNFSLIFKTANTDRGRITNLGNWAIGSAGTSSKLTVNSLTNVSAFRAQVNGSSKLVVNGNGSVSIGSSTAGPGNGLYVAGSTGIGIAAPAQKLHVVGKSAFMGNVGINSTAPTFPLDIQNPNSILGINVNNNFVGPESRIGIYTWSVNGLGYGDGLQAVGGWRGVVGTGQGNNYVGPSVGVYGFASGTTGVGERMGVSGYSTGGDANYGVFGQAATGTTFTAAGFFSGDVYADNYFSASDKKLKQEITPLTNIIEQVMKLKPTFYTFKTTEYKSMHLPKGRQIGVIADDLEEVFPELVSHAVHPAQYDNDRKQISAEIKYKGVNYQGLIPVLIASVQELNNKVEEQQNQIEELKEIIRRLDSNTPVNTKSWMKQNTPNPVSISTRIEYSIPQDVRSARILITNVKGQQLKVYNVNGTGSINFNVGTLPSGTYNYSLVTNGKTVSTKKLVIAR